MNLKTGSAGWALLFFAPLLCGQFGRPSLPGNPLAGITAEEFERFRLGLEDFVEVEDADEGLGPAFIQDFRFGRPCAYAIAQLRVWCNDSTCGHVRSSVWRRSGLGFGAGQAISPR